MSMLIQLVVNGIVLGSMYAIVTVGFALIFGTTRTFHVAYGATYALAAYVYIQVLDATHSVVIGIVASVLVAVVSGLAVDRVLYQPMINKTRASFLTIFVGSLGILTIVDNGIGLIWGTTFVSESTSLANSHTYGSVQLSVLDMLAVGLAVVIFTGLAVLLRRTTLGRALRAMANNPDLLGLYGWDVVRLRRWAFGIGSALVVPAAVIAVYKTGGTPTMGEPIVFVALAATIVGGVGSLPGAAITALILGLATDLPLAVVQSSWGTAIAFGVVLVVLLMRPMGVLASRTGP
jgi:branched-subunit amino acid ABC-type transport system permease component